MDAEQIRQMRDLLAAQPALGEPRTAGLRGTLTRLLTRKSIRGPTSPFDTPPAMDMSAAEAGADELVLTAADPAPCAPIPPQLLLGDLAPRRPAFGQRAERILELEDLAPETPRRLILWAAGEEAVGEIILHSGGGTALHAEAPFFPEDLADETFPRPKRRSDIGTQRSPSPRPAPELAEHVLLADLSARLADDDVALKRRLTLVLALSQAA